MIFKFENLGIVESATIELKGLTVITGFNDTGKSIISKTIYSIIKTIKDANEQELYNKIDALESLVRHVRVLLRPISPSIDRTLAKFRAEIFNQILGKVSLDSVIESVNLKKRQLIDELKAINAKVPTEQLEKVFEDIQKLILSDTETEKKYASYFDKLIIQQLFRSQINDLNSEKDLTINCTESGNELLNISVKNNKTETFKVKEQSYYQDATLIDTPIILNLAFFIRQQRVRVQPFVRSDIGLPIYYLDLISKLPSLQNSQTNNQTFQEIESLIDGTMVFKEQNDSFIFRKNNGNEIEVNNIASGIKSFGILQLLLNSEAINSRSILIIDEPEVHLHPIWIIEFARIIVELSKAGIPIIVSSHSPYLLQAIASYAKEPEISNIIKVYFGEKRKNSSHFRDITDDLEPIFRTLAKPMQDLFIND